MNKIFNILICISVFSATVFSQSDKKLTDSQRQEFEKQFTAKSKEIATLQCSFTQTKTSTILSQGAVSKGNMLYKNPSMLVWEYTQPTQSTLVVNGKSARLINERGKSIGNERILKQLGELIINMINGNSIADSKMFSSEVFETKNNQISVELKPIQKRLKDYYSLIKIKIERKTLMASEIIMEEKSGDKTVIVFGNLEMNKEIDNSKFKVTNTNAIR